MQHICFINLKKKTNLTLLLTSNLTCTIIEKQGDKSKYIRTSIYYMKLLLQNHIITLTNISCTTFQIDFNNSFRLKKVFFEYHTFTSQFNSFL